MATDNIVEKFPSPPNLPPGDSFTGKLRFRLRVSADLMISSVLLHLRPWLASLSGSVLEVGCGAQPYRHFIPSSCNYQGLDWDRAEELFDYKAPDTAYYSGGAFPFPDASFDNIFHTEVLEHIWNVEFFLSECRRVLRPGGRMFFAVPFQARYHYIPYDYWRFTPASLEKLLSAAGFRDISIKPRGSDITVAFYKFVSLTFRWLQGGPAAKLLGLITAPFAAIALIKGQISLRLKVGSPDDPLGFAVTATKAE